MEIMTQSRKKMRSVPSQRQAEYDLPKELLEFILSQLNLRDNILASAVSTRWLAAAVSVRRANCPPWLMFFPKHGDTFEFYDPANRNTYHLDIPEIRGFRICYARNNWLLIERPASGTFFLFCPYTRETVPLPNLFSTCEVVAFTSAPTSHDCVVFVVTREAPVIICIRTWRPGMTDWDMSYHQESRQHTFRSWSQAIFSNGCFYCLSLSGELGYFDVDKRTWFFCPILPSKLLRDEPSFQSFGKRWKAKFIAEHDGKMCIVCVCASEKPFIYMFNMVSKRKINSLRGLTIFVNDISSQARCELTGRMAGNIVFSKVVFYGRRCIMYAPGQKRYYPTDRLYDWQAEETLDRVWIEAPENPTSIFQ